MTAREQENHATFLNIARYNQEVAAREEQKVEDDDKSKWQLVGGYKGRRIIKNFRTSLKEERKTFDLRKAEALEIFTCIMAATDVSPRAALGEDYAIKNVRNNTVTVHTNDQERGEKYLGVRGFRYEGNEYEAHGYTANSENTLRIVVAEVFSRERETNNREILEELQRSNPKTPIIDAKRMGRSGFILITLGTKVLPGNIKIFRSINCYQIYLEKKQACTECRKMGRRADN
ncbi:hypothetical protein HPB47_022630 [Ixodes persulcatus]|uniref:Uncharacterized protein n=1 Tax=Ixodes persulcatus TaxID=34615 RepID=A0AC60QBF5_IXOPE|nr:hypothetical protein HPB47_022630 [Ixodes persulcatus]